MKTIVLRLLLTCGLLNGSFAAATPTDDTAPPAAPTGLGEVETKWPGIHYQITELDRIAGNRFLVVVRIYALLKGAPPSTLIGVPTPIPSNANKLDIQKGVFRPKAFSLASSVMIDQITQQKYPTLRGTEGYIPDNTIIELHPTDEVILSIQFTIPPPPPPPTDGQPPVKQKLSFWFPNSENVIVNIPVPPPDKPAPAAP